MVARQIERQHGNRTVHDAVQANVRRRAVFICIRRLIFTAVMLSHASPVSDFSAWRPGAKGDGGELTVSTESSSHFGKRFATVC